MIHWWAPWDSGQNMVLRLLLLSNLKQSTSYWNLSCLCKATFQKMWWWPHHPTKKSACQRKDLLLTLYLNLRTIRTSNGKSNSFERCADSQWISEASSKEPKVHFRVFFSVLQILQNMTRAANCSRPGLKSTPRRLLRRGKWSSSRLCGMESHVLYFCIFVFCKFWKWSIFRLCRMESHVLRRSRTGKCLNMLPWRWRCRENGRFSTFYGFNETIGGLEANY